MFKTKIPLLLTYFTINIYKSFKKGFLVGFLKDCKQHLKVQIKIMKIIVPNTLDKFALMIEYRKYRNKGMKLQQCKLEIYGIQSKFGG